MTPDTSSWTEHAKDTLLRHREAPLMTLRSSEVLGHAEGFIPRLVAYSHEDRAAKGLRSLKHQKLQAEPAIYFSALDMLAESHCLLLTSDAGGGKTAFGRHLLLCHSGDIAGDPVFGLHLLRNLLTRDDLSHEQEDAWSGAAMLPAMVRAFSGGSFSDVIGQAGDVFCRLLTEGSEADAPAPLLVIDDIDEVGDGWPRMSAEIGEALERHSRLRILALGDTRSTKSWALPGFMTRHALRPLSVPQRQAFEMGVLAPRRLSLPTAALGQAASSPALFALAQALSASGSTPEDILDAWRAGMPPDAHRPEADNRLVGYLSAARDLGKQPAAAATFFKDSARNGEPVLASLMARLADQPSSLSQLVERLLALPAEAGDRAALLAARAVKTLPDRTEEVRLRILDVITRGALMSDERAEAGRQLAMLGDPRDLEALVEVSGGTFLLGSLLHPNSTPPHRVTLSSFRMGTYPVTNAAYGIFVAQTGRTWASVDGLRPERANAPAGDLTWHDARAYCAWVTPRWRNAQRIKADEIVRLPTEAEWERAARGDMTAENVIHPWGVIWDNDRANAEPSGFNDTCAVGLFPRGCSPFGCHDMAGQVWEWCSTLWGQDMATPSFAYPYRQDDGREAPDAPDTVRRILRGGCFSSVAEKASATYRGSLEANGFWRGNGFRIVVARRH